MKDYQNAQNNVTYGMSVVICCYNSGERLPNTLEHLLHQKVPSDYLWEVVVVNNASTDHTLSVAKGYQTQFNAKQVSLKIINEDKAGQFFARIKGVSESIYEYIIFCDDDNRLEEHYVHNSIRMIEKCIHFGAGGGQSLPVTNAVDYPDWFEAYKDKYALGIPAKTSMEVTNRGFVLGAGLVTRKSLYLKMFSNEYPSLLNGRNGNILTTGDDFEYCKRLLLTGYKLYYDERLILHHFIPKERLTIAYRERLLEGIEQAGLVLDKYDAALRVKDKVRNKSRMRLFLLSPIRISMIKLGLSTRELALEKLIAFYVSPFKAKDPVTAVIKKIFLANR
ncbi:glycosyltransferase family 2 protein [Parapedobacter tibetensis]|uniref:glycosyltransferase family 2 protein n=1 Tax=Parapedobacter tibetensis TaxID=2972951 RepID=UPI00214D7725|nr:glycosyltransferase family 2 protein [Parapedobacter tibetensis]